MNVLLDELNVLISDLPSKTDRQITDGILDLLIDAYVYGYRNTADVFKRTPQIKEENLSKAINRKIDGKDYSERLGEYLKTHDLEAIAKVASTESHRIYNEASYTAATDCGATHKTWHTMYDDRVRDTHAYLEGMKKPIGEYFYTVNGNKAQYPGEFGEPEEDVNCRCYVTYE